MPPCRIRASLALGRGGEDEYLAEGTCQSKASVSGKERSSSLRQEGSGRERRNNAGRGQGRESQVRRHGGLKGPERARQAHLTVRPSPSVWALWSRCRSAAEQSLWCILPGADFCFAGGSLARRGKRESKGVSVHSGIFSGPHLHCGHRQPPSAAPDCSLCACARVMGTGRKQRRGGKRGVCVCVCVCGGESGKVNMHDDIGRHVVENVVYMF